MEAPGLEFVQLVGDPRRWRMLQELAFSDRRVAELTELLDVPQSVVSYHLKALRDGGLVSAKQSAADGRDTYYRVDIARCASGWSGAAAAVQPGLQLDPSWAPLPALRAPVRLLFLCTGNSARSQLAEGIARSQGRGMVVAHSAGSQPKAVHPNAVRVLAERGIDIVEAEPKHLRRFRRSRYDRVITLCDKLCEVCPDFPGAATAAHWSVPDPSLEGDSDDETYPAFVRVADDLELRITALLAQLHR